ncbi:hypothetical protein ACCS66_38405, partial [Rhizobium ruizarguesonis]
RFGSLRSDSQFSGWLRDKPNRILTAVEEWWDASPTVQVVHVAKKNVGLGSMDAFSAQSAAESSLIVCSVFEACALADPGAA